MDYKVRRYIKTLVIIMILIVVMNAFDLTTDQVYLATTALLLLSIYHEMPPAPEDLRDEENGKR